MTGATACSGIGAPEVALPFVDWRWCAEIEPFPSAVLDAHHPGSVNLGDITSGDFIERARAFGDLDVLVAGTPCQAFSVAGQRGSLSDSRGNLTFRLVEIVHAIKPRYLLYENVPGILSTDDNAFGCLLAGLIGADAPLQAERWTSAGVADGVLGTAAWRILDAQYFGLAQRRRRVFLVFCPRDRGNPAEILFEFDSRRRDRPPSREAGESAAAAIGDGAEGGGEDDGLIVSSVTRKWSKGSGGPSGDECQKLVAQAFGGNNSSGPIDVATACCAHGGPHGRLSFQSETFIAHSLRADGFDASEDGTGRETPLTVVPILEQSARTGASTTDPRAGIGIGEAGDPMFTLQPGKQHAVAFQSSQSGVREVEAHATLDSNNGSRRHNGVATGMAVRRLTPRECERLMGFPDDYTLIRFRGKLAADGVRYKALGNSIATPVIRWIGDRVLRELGDTIIAAKGA